MVDEGLDEEDPEAVEHAADILQAEAEAYHARLRAAETGHYGFWSKGQGRQFQVSGSLSLEEKKQRIQALKAKSTCRRCGRVGHWSGDPGCPKGQSKGKGKYGTPSTTSTAPTQKGGKSSKGRGSEKPRTVYFSVNEYVTDKAYDVQSYMVLRADDGRSADEMLDALPR